jgi:hypothetical protein
MNVHCYRLHYVVSQPQTVDSRHKLSKFNLKITWRVCKFHHSPAEHSKLGGKPDYLFANASIDEFTNHDAIITFTACYFPVRIDIESVSTSKVPTYVTLPFT